MKLPLAPLFCTASDVETICAFAGPISLASDPAAPLPREIVWVPAGDREIHAFGPNMVPVKARVVGDEAGAKAIATHFEELRAQGVRVWLDKMHQDAEATADVRAFSWDPARGIIATVDWTGFGERLLRERTFCSFSPAFLRNKSTGRPSRLILGHASGGLVNAPAFGAAMPALIAARLAGAESLANSASGVLPDNPQTHRIMKLKDLLVKIMAALAVAVPPNATEEQLVALASEHIDELPQGGGEEGEALKAQLAELQTLKAADSARRKTDAKKAVDEAVARGALPAKDEAIQAKWAGLIEADPNHAQLLASLPGNPALSRVTQPGTGGGVQAKDNAVECLRALASKKTSEVAERGLIYSREIAPLFAKHADFNVELMELLAANSLGTLSGELVTQRSLSLLKLSFPWLPKISTDFSATGAKLNQTVQVRLRSVPTLSDFVPGTGYGRKNAVTTDVPVSISAHKGVEIAFNANELASTSRDLFGEQVEGCHYAIGKGLVDAVLALITVANFPGESVEATVDVDADTMDSIDAALAARGVQGPRIGLLTSAVYRKLGKDSSIVQLAAFQKPDVITAAMLPPIKNIQPHEVFNMPAPAGENLTGFACVADALALATRLPNDYTLAMPDVSSNGTVQIVTNPDIGISVALTRYIDHKAAESAWRLALMWGAAKGNPDCGQRLISAARA